MTADERPYAAVAFSDDGNTVAFWSSEKQVVRLWAFGSGNAPAVLGDRQMACTPDGSQLVAASGEAVDIWPLGSDFGGSVAWLGWLHGARSRARVSRAKRR